MQVVTLKSFCAFVDGFYDHIGNLGQVKECGATLSRIEQSIHGDECVPGAEVL
jgi:hypothetical protein